MRAEPERCSISPRTLHPSIFLSRCCGKAIGGEERERKRGFRLNSTRSNFLCSIGSLLQFAAERGCVFTRPRRLTCIMCRGDGIILFPAPTTRCMPNAQSCLCWHHSKWMVHQRQTALMPSARTNRSWKISSLFDSLGRCSFSDKMRVHSFVLSWVSSFSSLVYLAAEKVTVHCERDNVRRGWCGNLFHRDGIEQFR